MNIGRTGPAVTAVGAGSFALAANSSFDFRANAGQVSDIIIVVKTGTSPTAATHIDIWDGTTPFQVAITAIATGALASASITGNQNQGGRITNNDAAVGATAMYSGFNWKI